MRRFDVETILYVLDRGAASGDADYSILASNRNDSPTAHIAISRAGAAAVLVPLRQIGSETIRITHGIALRGLTMLEFIRDGERSRTPAAVLECREPKLLKTFAGMCTAFVSRLVVEEPSWPLVSSLFAEWERLLGRRRTLTGESELGLWGELWCIVRTTRPVDLLKAWRGPESEHTDFFLDGVGLEVKTSRRAGVHVVSQGQVDEPVGETRRLLVSLHVMSDPVRGRSLAHLVRTVAASVGEVAMFEEKLAAVGYSRDDEEAYTRPLAVVEPPLFYEMASVPRIRNADPGISRIRYQVELPRDAALREPDLDAATSTFGIDPNTYEFPCA